MKDDKPVIWKPRILPEAYEKDIYIQINELLDKGVIEISDSPYASPIVPVVKRDCSIRLCCDYRKLNEKTIPKTFPIPRNENLLDLHKAEVYTVLDLKSEYWHIPIKQDDQHKTAFVVPNGKYQWTVLPYGLSDAAFSLAYVMNEVLREFEFAKGFFDDCIIFGNRVDHLRQIETVLNKFAELGIHVNMSKYKFMNTEVTFIGHTVSRVGIRLENTKAQELIDFRKPEEQRELKTFLGVAAYFRKFINNFSDVASCLYNLLKKNVPYNWTDECETSFNILKASLENVTLLHHADFTKPFVLTTDASNKAIGFALMLERDGKLVPIMFGGRILTDPEKRYSTTVASSIFRRKEVQVLSYWTTVCCIYRPQTVDLFGSIQGQLIKVFVGSNT